MSDGRRHGYQADSDDCSENCALVLRHGEKMRELAIKQQEFSTRERLFRLEEERFEKRKKEFEEEKLAFLVDNALVPEWKEKEAEKLLMFDAVVEANVNLNMLYCQTLFKVRSLEKKLSKNKRRLV